MMERIRLEATEIKYMTLFENLTGAKVRDCVSESNTIGFLVEKGYMGLAIGKNGTNISRAMKFTGKNIVVMESFPDINNFMSNLFQPLKIRNSRVMEDEGKKVAIVEINKRDRSKVIGPDGVRIKIARKLADRHFGVSDIKIKAI